MAVVKMRVALMGPDVSVAPGEFFTCDDQTAARLVASAQADLVVPEAPETTMREPLVERAIKPKSKGRG